MKFWATSFPDRKPEHYVFPRERYGGKGKKGELGFTDSVPYDTDLTRPIGDIKEGWEKAKLRGGELLHALKGETNDEITPLVCRFHDLRHTAVSRMVSAGVPLAKIASRVMLGASLAQLRSEGLLKKPVSGKHVSVKEAVLPFSRFPEVDTALGPEMRSTGEVMGIDSTFGRAFVKAEIAAGTELPTSGMVFLSLNDRDKPSGLVVAKRLRELGLGIVATSGTADYLQRFGHPVDRVVGKVSETTAAQSTRGKKEKNSQPDDAVELIKRGEIAFVINTPQGRGGRSDGEAIRKAANIFRVSSVTTINAALAAVQGLFEQQEYPLEVK